MSKELAALPWVEPSTIRIDEGAKTATFGITDKSKFSLDAVKAKLATKYRSGLEVQKAP